MELLTGNPNRRIEDSAHRVKNCYYRAGIGAVEAGGDGVRVISARNGNHIYPVKSLYQNSKCLATIGIA